jgi:Tfp pilus assembly protein PilF
MPVVEKKRPCFGVAESVQFRLAKSFLLVSSAPALAMSQQHSFKSLIACCNSIVAACLLASTFAGCQVAAMGQNAQGARLYQHGQYQAALQQFQQASASDPNNADAYYNMAATVHHLGTQQNNAAMLSQAETLYNQCLDIDPNHVDCYRGLGVLLVETDRADRAFALMKNWVTRSPVSADARIELARLFEEFGDEETATLHLEHAIQLDQSNSRAWTALAHLREEQGDNYQALANYQKAYSLNPMQSQIADRIASLNRVVYGNTNIAMPGDTRTVQNGRSARY